MATLTIDLQEGFEGDQVVITIDDREVFNKPGVKTRYQIGLAERVRLDVAPGSRRLRVALPGRSLQQELQVDAAATPVLAVSLAGDRIDVGPLKVPGYL